MTPTCPHMAWCLTNWDQYKVLFFDSRYQSQLIQFTVGGLRDRLSSIKLTVGGLQVQGRLSSIDWTGWRSRGREKFCLLLYPGYALLFRAFRFCLHCVLSLSDFSLRVNVFYIKGFIRFFTFFLVLFFCWFSLFLLFPRLANPFLAADQRGYYTFLWQTTPCYTFLWPTTFLYNYVTLFYYKQLRGTVTLFPLSNKFLDRS